MENKKPPKDIFLSVVIPVYNEEDKIEKTLAVITDYIKDKYSYEILVVDDGSRDNTYEIVKKIAANRPNIRVLTNRINRGKGYSLKVGMTAVYGEYILFTDADLSAPIDEIEKFWPFFNEGYEVVIGSRRIEGSDIQIHQPFYREFMGKVFIWLARILVTKKVDDFNCGFKCYKAEVAHHLYGMSTLERWGFDVEICFLIAKYNYKIREVPVRWINVTTTKVSLIKDSLRSFVELLQIRMNNIRGFYK